MVRKTFSYNWHKHKTIYNKRLQYVAASLCSIVWWQKNWQLISIEFQFSFLIEIDQWHRCRLRTNWYRICSRKKSTNICCSCCLSADGLWKSICHKPTHVMPGFNHNHYIRVWPSHVCHAFQYTVSMGSGLILPTESIDRKMIKLQVFKAHYGIL